MRRLLPLATLLLAPAAAPPEPSSTYAGRVTITRDDWGIAHVRGRSDADAVFGAIYAQAEDDFPRIEANLLAALGRTAEAEGEGAVWRDLRQRLWIDEAALRRDYAAAPAWLRRLAQAWAAGLNFYLARHPEERPRALTRFEPWMALSFTEGSIGGDIERVDLDRLARFYDGRATAAALARDRLEADEPRGSNGIAIAPQLTRDGHALLLINPHTSFFFRAELGMASDEGLNAYGAATWGQFFLYQGFNDRVGWMHTSSGVDAVDTFAQAVARTPRGWTYRFGRQVLPVTERTVALRVRRADGSLGERRFTVYATRHGPVVGADGGRWLSVALMHRPVAALEQSWLRTRARSFRDYLAVAGRRADASNNTLFASADGTIAYLHPQFVPVRDDRFDYRGTVDGSDPRTAWRGLTPLAGLPQVVNPRAGWIYNSNDAPWAAAGADSPVAGRFPRYMDQVGANPRGEHATALLARARALTPDGLRDIAYDPWMPVFGHLIPGLAEAWDALPQGTRKARLAAPVAALRRWDARWASASWQTALAVFWAGELWERAGDGRDGTRWERMAALPPDARIGALEGALDRLQRDFGGWRVPWGEVNRFQRFDASGGGRFDDARPSVPVPFASARWGSLASFGAEAYPGTRRWYGTSGNSFVAVVEFGPRVRAWAVTAGGASGRPGSRHYNDQAERYAAGRLRPVYFWPDELAGHVERRYRPGE
jgi:acyl-homoserine-lactone acylase